MSSSTIKDALHPDTFGLVALILISQIGSKLIVEEVHNRCSNLLDNASVKILVLYSILYLATKDKMVAVVWTVGMVMIWQLMINGPGRKYCLTQPDNGQRSFQS